MPPAKSPRETAGPGPRPDVIKQAREALEGLTDKQPAGLQYTDPDSGVTVLAVPQRKVLEVLDDADLDTAILELKAKAPEAFKRFLARAIYKETLYMPPEAADTSVHLRRVGAMSVACNVNLLVGGAERRVHERQRRDAKSRQPAGQPGGASRKRSQSGSGG